MYRFAGEMRTYFISPHFFPSFSRQQQKAARFLGILAFYKQGLTVIASHNVVEHLLWAVTCSQCR